MLKNLPLKLRMMLYSTVMIIAVVSILATILLYYHHRHVWNEFKLRAESLSAGLSHDLQLPLMLEDKASIERMLKGFSTIEDVVSVSVLNKENIALVKQGNPFSIPESLRHMTKHPVEIESEENLSEHLEGGIPAQPDIPTQSPSTSLRTSVGARGGMEKIGLVEITFSTKRIGDNLENMVYVVIFFTIFIIILRLASDYIFTSGITRPITMLMQGAEAVSDGDLSHTIEIKSSDEVGKLSSSFNRMIIALKDRDDEIRFQHQKLQNNYKELEDSHKELDEAYETLAETAKELEEHKTELENKVVERTKELHDAHARLQESYERLKEIDRLKSEFLANMSHELRTPLNSIIGFSKVILKGIDGPITDIQKTDLTAIHNSGQHLLTIINDILDLSKIESGKMELLKEMIDIGEIAEGVMSTADALAMGKPVKLNMELEEKLPLTFVDKTRIRQVMLNMLSNAIKFTDKGEIRLKVSKIGYEHIRQMENNPDGYCPKRSPVREGDFILVSVTDTGIGIKREDMPLVFEEFRQIDSSSARREGGTGLGMAISHKFILLHGGEIWVESRTGKGSTFHFTVPVSKVLEQTRPAVERIIAPVDREKEVIMVIDDEINSITLIRRTLEREGYEVVGIQDPDEAIERVGEIRPNAIILDVIMPKRDGWEIIQELKLKPETKDIPVIFCTIVADKKLGFSLGATDYLVKPVRDDDLLRALKMLNGSVKNILVIDDTPQDAELVGRFLKGHGYTVRIALGGREGIGYIKRHKPELIIVDLMMPEVDGFTVIEEAKRDPATKNIPIIVVSAKDITAEDRKRLNGCIEALIGKGMLNEDELMQEIVKALKKVSGER